MDDVKLRISADGSHLDRSLTTAGQKMRRWGGKVSADLSRTLRGSFRGLTDIAGFGGIAGLALASKAVLDFETRITRLQIASRSTANQMNALRKAIFDAATTKGVDPDQLLGGIEKFVALTGNVELAKDSLDSFAKTAAATGANVEDITTTAAALADNFKISAKEMETAFSILHAGGKAGAVEFKDLAGVIAGLAPQFATFGKTGTAGLIEMSALLQRVRTGFGSSAEAATGLAALMTAVSKNAKNLGELGVKVWGRSLSEIIFDLAKVGDKGPKQLQQVQVALGREEAFKAFLKFTKDGRVEFDKLVQAEREGTDEIDKDSKIWKQSVGGRIAAAGADIKKSFNDALLDKLDHIAGAFELMAKGIGLVTEHLTEAAIAFAGLKAGGMLSSLAAGFAAVGSSATTAAGGIGKMSSTFAAAGPILAAGVVAIEGLAVAWSKMIDAENKAIVKAPISSPFAIQRAEELGVRNVSIGAGILGLPGPTQTVPVTGALNEEQRAAASWFLRRAIDVGAIDAGLADQGIFPMDMRKVDQLIAGQPNLTKDQRRQLRTAFEGAHRSLSTDPELRASVRRSRMSPLEFFGPPGSSLDEPIFPGGPPAGMVIPKESPISITAGGTTKQISGSGELRIKIDAAPEFTVTVEDRAGKLKGRGN